MRRSWSGVNCLSQSCQHVSKCRFSLVCNVHSHPVLSLQSYKFLLQFVFLLMGFICLGCQSFGSLIAKCLVLECVMSTCDDICLHWHDLWPIPFDRQFGSYFANLTCILYFSLLYRDLIESHEWRWPRPPQRLRSIISIYTIGRKHFAMTCSNLNKSIQLYHIFLSYWKFNISLK